MRTKQVSGGYDEEYRVLRPDGSSCWVRDRAFPVRNDKGEVFRLVGITEDNTERKRAAELLQIQRDVAVALSMTSDATSALEGFLAALTRLEGVHCAGAYLVNAPSEGLNLEAQTGLQPNQVSELMSFPSLNRPEEVVKAWHRACRKPAVAKQNSHRAGITTVVTNIPLQHGTEAIGLLLVGSAQELPAQTRAGLEAVADQAAGAIVRIRAERQILEVTDREQARIGQDIHDGLCQQLVGALFDAKTLLNDLNVGAHPESRLAARICSQLDDAITESRRVARGLYPVRLETDGLTPALQELAAGLGERFQIKTVCALELKDFSCDLTTGTHLYRIAQEALTNAARHSGAKTITLRLSKTIEGVELEIRDDGKGSNSPLNLNAGMGLQIMAYRARSIGARLRICQSPGGTGICCLIPDRGEVA